MRQMRLKAQIILVAETYSQATGLKDGRVSTLVFGSGDRLKRLRAGKGAISDKLEDALEWFSDRWPEGAVWPEPVPRPVPHPQSTATRTASSAVASAAPSEECGPGGAVASSDSPAASS